MIDGPIGPMIDTMTTDRRGELIEPGLYRRGAGVYLVRATFKATKADDARASRQWERSEIVEGGIRVARERRDALRAKLRRHVEREVGFLPDLVVDAKGGVTKIVRAPKGTPPALPLPPPRFFEALRGR